MRTGRPAAALLLLAGLLVTLAGAGGLARTWWSGRIGFVAGPIPHVAVPRGSAVALARPQDGPVPAPLFLVIPAIGVRTRLVRLAVTSQGVLGVPSSPTVAGWFTPSPRPGAIGSSVIAGHVDSHTGIGVFFRLRLLRPGDRIFVLRADGSLVRFTVYAVRTYLKAAFPAAAVYGPVPFAGLRLVTCGGAFDRATGSYLSNVVAFARQIGP